MNLVIKIIILLLVLNSSFAFDNERYQNILGEYRCLVCQNQTLLDSDASFANDLRTRIKKFILNGKTDLEIKEDLVNHYGTAILANPPKSSWHLIVWLAPVWMALIFIYLYYYKIKN